MISAFGEERDRVLLKDIQSAVGELQWVEYAARASTIAAKQAARRTAAAGGEDYPPRVLSKVVLSTDGKAVAELHLVPGRKVVGRTPDNDLQIDSKFISRHHCQVITDSDGVSAIEDLNSTNGITIRGKRVRRHTLRDGDVIGLGQYELLYVNHGAAAHLADTHDELTPIDADAANEESGDDEREDAARAR
jgi:hypothetical protein